MSTKKKKSTAEEILDNIDLDELDIDLTPKKKRTTKKKTTKKKKDDDNMAAEPGLKGVKKMLQDQVEIGILKDMAMGGKPKLPTQPKPKQVQKPAQAVPYMPYNPMAGLMQNPELLKDPQAMAQAQQLMMMSNPNTAMMMMLMNNMGGGQKTTQDVSNLKDLAEVIALLRGDTSNNSLNELLLKQLIMNKNKQQGNGSSDLVAQLVQINQQQMAEMANFWKSKAMAAEESYVDPIDALFQNKEKMTMLQTLFGGGSETDKELRMKQFELEALEKQRTWDRENRELQLRMELQKSNQQAKLIEQGLNTLVGKVIAPVMDGVKQGMANQISNPNMFENISPELPPSEPSDIPSMNTEQPDIPPDQDIPMGMIPDGDLGPGGRKKLHHESFFIPGR